MAAPGKLVALFAMLICCVLQEVQGEKWRGVAKLVRRCDTPLLAIEFPTLKISYRNRGETFRLTSDVVISRNITCNKVHVNVFRSGGSALLKIMTWTFTDVCSKILEGNEYIDPLFSPTALPRQCSFTPYNYSSFIADYDLHGEMIGSALRGEYMVEVKGYDQTDLIMCFHAYGLFKKDTHKD